MVNGEFKSASAALSDEVLICAVANNDENALAALYDRYNQVVFGFLLQVVKNRLVAESVLQEVFVQLWHEAGAFDAKHDKAAVLLENITRRKAVERLNYLMPSHTAAANPEVFQQIPLIAQ